MAKDYKDALRDEQLAEHKIWQDKTNVCHHEADCNTEA
jgi:hypothetical protein